MKLQDNVIFDRFNFELGFDLTEVWFEETASAIKEGSYQFIGGYQKVIYKSNGSSRLVTIVNLRDKIVQTSIKLALELVYEGIFNFSLGNLNIEQMSSVFLGCSHGFRPKRGCHTALLQISS